MKQSFRRIIVLLLCIPLLLALFPTPAAAQASVRIETEPTSVEKGSTVTVTLTFSSDQPLEAIEASLSYDAGRMAFQSGGGQYAELSGGTGSIQDMAVNGQKTRSYTFHFVALQTGTATFSVLQSTLWGTSGAIVGNPAQAIHVNIVEASPAPTPAAEPIGVIIDGVAHYVMREMEDTGYPEGFFRGTATFQGEEIQALYNTAAGLTLLNVMDLSGRFDYFILQEDETLIPFIILHVNQFYIILEHPMEIEGYTPCILRIQSSAVSAWQHDINPDFFLVYATRADGAPGLYLYDRTEGTLQRWQNAPIDPAPTPTPAPTVPPTAARAVPWSGIAIGLTISCLCLIAMVVFLLTRKPAR